MLEGITGLPSPRQDRVCTNFATEVVLRHSDSERVLIATFMSTASRPERGMLKLQHYRRQLVDQ